MNRIPFTVQQIYRFVSYGYFIFAQLIFFYIQKATPYGYHYFIHNLYCITDTSINNIGIIYHMCYSTVQTRGQREPPPPLKKMSQNSGAIRNFSKNNNNNNNNSMIAFVSKFGCAPKEPPPPTQQRRHIVQDTVHVHVHVRNASLQPWPSNYYNSSSGIVHTETCYRIGATVDLNLYHLYLRTLKPYSPYIYVYVYLFHEFMIVFMYICPEFMPQAFLLCFSYILILFLCSNFISNKVMNYVQS